MKTRCVKFSMVFLLLSLASAISFAQGTANEDLATLDILNSKMSALFYQGKLDQAIAIGKRVNAAADKLTTTANQLRPDQKTNALVKCAHAKIFLVGLYGVVEDFEQAESFGKQAVAYKDKFSKDTPGSKTASELIGSLATISLANCYYSMGNNKLALTHAEDVLGQTFVGMPEVFTMVKANALVVASQAAIRCDQLDKGSRFLKQVEAIRNQNTDLFPGAGKPGKQSNEMIQILDHMITWCYGLLYNARGEFNKAEPKIEDALAGVEKYFPFATRRKLEMLLELQWALAKQGKHKNRAILVVDINKAADIYRTKKRYFDAELLYEVVLDILSESPNNSDELIRCLHNLGDCYLETGYRLLLGPVSGGFAKKSKIVSDDSSETRSDYVDKAKRVYQQALDVAEKAHGPSDLKVGKCLDKLGYFLLWNVDGETAIPDLARSLEIKEKALGKDDLDVAEVLVQLGDCHLDASKCELGDPLFKRALAITESQLGPDDPLVADRACWVAMNCMHQNKYSEAEKFYIQALRVIEKGRNGDKKKLDSIMSGLGDNYRADASDQRMRNWKSASGKHSRKAVYVSVDGDKVKLQLEDNRTISVLISKLSREDKDYLLLRECAFGPSATDITQLVEVGANVNAIGNLGQTPLMLLMRSTTDPNIVNALLEAGADVTLSNKIGKRAVEYVIGYREGKPALFEGPMGGAIYKRLTSNVPSNNQTKEAQDVE